MKLTNSFFVSLFFTCSCLLYRYLHCRVGVNNAFLFSMSISQTMIHVNIFRINKRPNLATSLGQIGGYFPVLSSAKPGNSSILSYYTRTHGQPPPLFRAEDSPTHFHSTAFRSIALLVLVVLLVYALDCRLYYFFS